MAIMKSIVIEAIETGISPNAVLEQRLEELRKEEREFEEKEVNRLAEEEELRKCLW